MPLRDVIKHLKNLPSAELEQKTGKWIDITKSDGCFLWKCSECGNDYIEETDYCPYCGAKMETNNEN